MNLEKLAGPLGAVGLQEPVDNRGFVFVLRAV